VGVFGPEMKPTGALGAGAVGYVATGLKSVLDCRVGDTLTSAARQAAAALPGYIPAKPMVFAGLYPVERDDYAALRDALERLQLNDASLVFEPESSQALQFGFRCGFLGLFHMEIIQERLEREYGLNLIATAPSVAYEVELQDGQVLSVSRPSDWPEETIVEEVREPWMDIQVFTPAEYIGPVMEVIASRRGTYETTEYLDASRVILHYKMPLAEVIVDLHDRLKSITRGYASLDYALASYQPGDMVKLEVLVNKEPVDALSLIVHRDKAQAIGSAIVRKMRAVIPRQLFKVPIQAALGGRIIARATVSAKRKDVLAKCYGGDVTRKRKLLEKQKAGKKRMKQFGQVSVPQEAFLAVLKLGEE
jgi:GTP-binding protein LepA